MIQLENVREMSKRSGAKKFLIDLEWPKGITRFIPHKEKSGTKKASLAEIKWCPQLAPRFETWKWFQSNLDKISQFRSRYFRELEQKKRHWLPIVQDLQDLRRHEVTLLYDSKYSPWTPAHFFKEFLDLQMKTSKRRPEQIKHVVRPGLGVAVPIEKAISRKGARPLKEEMKFKPEQKLKFVEGDKRKILR